MKKGKGLVLVIDDEKELRDMLAEVIELLNYQVIKAKNGEEGLKIAFEKNPDIIFTDVDMPGISGLQVIYQLRNNSRFQKTKIVVMTGNLSYKEESKKVGADEFIRKPFNLYSIKRIVDTLD